MAFEATVRVIGRNESDGVPVVVLAADDRVVPILVSPDQAHAIQHARSGERFERPLTHDVLVEMVTEFGGVVDQVRIDEVSGGTFFAKLDAEKYDAGERRTRTFDVRASDAIAVALRADCPIEVSESVLDHAGKPSDELDVQGE